MDGRQVRSYSYKPNVSTEYTRFREEYFSGNDVRIYFGDIWVDEITNLQFTMQEQVAPIFGYSSYVWDRVARGNRYVEGSFVINFKESGYLHMMMDTIARKYKDNKQAAVFNTDQWKQGVTLEHLVNNAGGSGFDSMASEFEKSLWGEGNDKKMNKVISSRSKQSFFYPEFGSTNKDDGTMAYDNTMSQKYLAENGFNIVIGYGPMNEKNGNKASRTSHTIVGVQLTGVRQIIAGDGQPVQEVYTFIARDLDGDVTKLTYK